jgi:hypothetical protein
MNNLIERIDYEVESFETCAKSQLLRDCRAEICRLEALREYVPMRDYEWASFWRNQGNGEVLPEVIEMAVVTRAGLVFK